MQAASSEETLKSQRGLIDCGGSANFVSRKLISRLNLIPEDIYAPAVRGINNVLIDDACLDGYFTLTITLGSIIHRGLFRAINCTDYDIILGLPWLEKHNPIIDWQTKQILPRTARHEIQPMRPDLLLRTLDEEDTIMMIKLCSTDLDEDDEDEVNPEAPKSTVVLPPEYAEFEDVFNQTEAAKLPGHRPSIDHEINLLPGTEPPYKPLYNMSESELATLRDYIETNLASGFIRRSSSSAGAPILFVKKKDGTLRLVVDYRGLNSITIKDRYPLPLIPDMLDRLAEAEVFTKLDLITAYNEIRIKKGQEWMSAFRTRYGNFEYCVMPFGLCNAGATFQSFVDSVLKSVIDRKVIVYLDDILIFGKKETHAEDVKEVLGLLRGAKLYAKLSKCEFSTDRVEFLGFIVSPKGIEMDKERVRTISEWPEPKTLKEVQAFLGLCNFYRRFVERYSKTALALTNLTKKDQKFVFSDAARRAFEKLKDAFTRAPLLVHFKPELPCYVEPDSSGSAIAGIISQRGDDGHLHPVAFYSRKMTSAEVNYTTGDQELLAIVACFKTWRHYLEGAHHKVTVLSDHANLQTFNTTMSLSRRQARWAEYLSTFDFVVFHRPGKNNPADAPSRRPDLMVQQPLKKVSWNKLQLAPKGANPFPKGTRPRKDASPESNRTKPLPTGTLPRKIGESKTLSLAYLSKMEEWDVKSFLTLGRTMVAEAKDISLAVLSDIEISLQDKIKKSLETDEFAQEVLARPEDHDDFTWSNGMLFYDGTRIYVPEEDRERILHDNHDSPLAGHFGQAKTAELISRNFYWPGLRDSVRDYCRTCDSCQRIKTPRRKPNGELEPLPVPTQPWADISIDFITDLPPSRSSIEPSSNEPYDAILTIVDRYTKSCHFIPTRKTLSKVQFAHLIIKEVVRLHCIPTSIVSDRGSIFTSKFWQALSKALKITSRLSTAFHPETDGQTERANQVIEQYLRAHVAWLQDDWVDLLPLAEYAYNNAKNATTGVTPFYADHGVHPRPFAMTELDINGKEVAAIQHAEEIGQTHRILSQSIEHAQAYQKKWHDAHHQPTYFKVGDKVLLNSKNLRTSRPCKKLQERYYGPYPIAKRVGSQAYKLFLPKSFNKVYPVFHVSLLKEYNPDTREGEMPDPLLVTEEGAEDYEEYYVDEIVDSKYHRRKLKYHIKWTGVHDPTWEPAESIQVDTPELVKEFHKKYPFKPGPLLRNASPPPKAKGSGTKRPVGRPRKEPKPLSDSSPSPERSLSPERTPSPHIGTPKSPIDSEPGPLADLGSEPIDLPSEHESPVTPSPGAPSSPIEWPDIEDPPKRGRGRPRKRPPPNPHDTPPGSPTNPHDTPPPRKRGRPRKT